METSGEWLPFIDASKRTGVSVQTLRRRLKEGKLRGRQTTTSHGLAWQVWITKPDQNQNGVGEKDNLASFEEDNQLSTLEEPASTTLPMLQLIQWLKELQQENRELAGSLGYTRAQLELAQQKLLMLEPPNEESVEATAGQVIPWWRRWWAKLGLA